jgi:hypothetical protein
MEKLLSKLDQSRAQLMFVIESVDGATLSRKPSPDAWCITQIVQHLILVEGQVLKALLRTAADPHAQKPGMLARMKPVSVVTLRTIKRKAPARVEPRDVPQLSELISNLAGGRKALRDFAVVTGKDGLRNLSFKHPFLGVLDGIGAIKFLRNHEIRHLKQIREVLKGFENHQ